MTDSKLSGFWTNHHSYDLSNYFFCFHPGLMRRNTERSNVSIQGLVFKCFKCLSSGVTCCNVRQSLFLQRASCGFNQHELTCSLYRALSLRGPLQSMCDPSNHCAHLQLSISTSDAPSYILLVICDHFILLGTANLPVDQRSNSSPHR